MLKEEKILKDKFGTANHFTVPEGYFDSFAEKLMESLPAPEPQAASVVAVVGFGSLFFTHQQASQQPEMAHVNLVERVSSNDENRSFDVMADYAMIDNQDIYASLAAGL